MNLEVELIAGVIKGGPPPKNLPAPRLIKNLHRWRTERSYLFWSCILLCLPLYLKWHILSNDNFPLIAEFIFHCTKEMCSFEKYTAFLTHDVLVYRYFLLTSLDVLLRK